MKETMNSVLTQEDLDSLPDLPSYIEDLKRLDSFDFSDSTTEEIYHRFYDLARIFPLKYEIFKPEKFNTHLYYRVRLNINPNEEDLSLIQTYSYPPSFICKENGRANLKGKSVFYCSNSLRSAIYESKPKGECEGFISVWKGNTTRPIKFGLCLPDKLPDVNEWQLTASDMAEYHYKYLLTYAKDKIPHYQALNDFIATKFISEEKPYYLTSMLSDISLFDKEFWRDCILYPGVLSKGTQCNIAFHPNSVNENLKFEKVFRIRIVSNDNDLISFKIGKVGYIENTHINWRNLNEDEIKLFKENTD